MSTGPPDESTNDERPRDPARAVFAAVAPCGAVFVVTILAMIAAAFGEPGSATARFFDEFGLTIIVAEAGLTIVVTLLAMAFDRWITLRRSRTTNESERSSSSSGSV